MKGRKKERKAKINGRKEMKSARKTIEKKGGRSEGR
jgi:hypothetical protein